MGLSQSSHYGVTDTVLVIAVGIVSILAASSIVFGCKWVVRYCQRGRLEGHEDQSAPRDLEMGELEEIQDPRLEEEDSKKLNEEELEEDKN